MKKLFYFILFPLLGLGDFASAQTYSLQKCIDVAIEKSPEVARGQLSRELRENNLAVINTNRLPSFGFGVSQGANFGRSIDRFTNEYTNSFYNQTYSGLQFDLPLFRSFRNDYQKRSTKAMIESDVQSIESTKNRLKLTITRAYFDVLAQQELLQVAKIQLANSQRQIERQNKLMDAGTGLKLDFMQLQNQLAADELSLVDAQAGLENGVIILFQAMNEKPNFSATFEQIEMKDFAKEVTENQVIDEMPEIKSLNFQVSSFIDQLKSMKTNQLPQVGLSGGYGLFYASSNTERNFFQQLNDTRNGNIGLNLNIPIAGGLINKPRIQDLKIQQKIAQNQVETAKLKLKQDFELVAQNYRIAAKRHENALKQVAIAKETLTLVEKKIDAGTLNLTEYILAQTTLERASSNLIRVKYNWAMQVELVRFYQGR